MKKTIAAVAVTMMFSGVSHATNNGPSADASAVGIGVAGAQASSLAVGMGVGGNGYGTGIGLGGSSTALGFGGSGGQSTIGSSIFGNSAGILNGNAASNNQSVTFTNPAQQTITQNGRIQVASVPSVLVQAASQYATCDGAVGLGGSLVGGGGGLTLPWTRTNCWLMTLKLDAQKDGDKESERWYDCKLNASLGFNVPKCRGWKENGDEVLSSTTPLIDAHRSATWDGGGSY